MAEDVVGRRAGRTMRIKNRGWFWSEEIEDAFFDHLAANGNVSAAADAVGFGTPTVYRQRQRRPEFAARWQAAIEQGYVRLEIALLEAANDTLAGKEFDAERPIPKMTIEQAMNVLRAHQNLIANNGRAGPGNRAKPRPLEEVRASILRKVEAILAMEEQGESGGEGATKAPSALPLPPAGGD